MLRSSWVSQLLSFRKYQDFLTLWKDAGPDTPLLQEAKAEYAKLQVTQLNGEIPRLVPV